ncbi:MAG: hypothetical protein R3C05_28010 [Pirellulaceae bacterium]
MEGKLNWISTAADSQTRMVQVSNAAER